MILNYSRLYCFARLIRKVKTEILDPTPPPVVESPQQPPQFQQNPEKKFEITPEYTLSRNHLS